MQPPSSLLTVLQVLLFVSAVVTGVDTGVDAGNLGEGNEENNGSPVQQQAAALLSQHLDVRMVRKDVVLADFPQWQAEVGYWIGTFTFYAADGAPKKNAGWNYRYDDYRGFITGNVKGNSYRQRNVFLYPPQFERACEEQVDSSMGIAGEGKCGVNGNTKVFSADQSATTCSENPERAGDIEGLFGANISTTTELVGKGNALLYQCFLGDALLQSQLTTLTIDGVTGARRRTRSAQGFHNGMPRFTSFYREGKVTKEEFYRELEQTLTGYNIMGSDTCTWVDPPSFYGPVVDSSYTPGIQGCMDHLEQSFEL
jgi:hypothetical protein